MEKNNYIGVCGNIASGKSTLASILKNKNTNVVFEDFEKNVFLEAFYNDPTKYSFETELTFLLQHYFFIKQSLKKYQTNIFDFSILLDRAYADVTLSPARKKLFHLLADELECEIGLPSKIIFLYCSEESLINRIKKRKREFEKSITIEYLTALNKSIEIQMSLISAKIDVIKIDSDLIDFSSNEEYKISVRSQILGSS